jgi:hypothetical protein
VVVDIGVNIDTFSAVGYDVLQMPDGPNSEGEDERKQLELSDFTHGAQSAKAACGCFAVAVFLAAVAFAARTFLFK